MTINTVGVTTGPYTGNGVTSSFSYDFPIADKSELLVFIDSVEQTVDTDYTVTGVGDPDGGLVVFGTAPTTGETLFIRSNRNATQGVAFDSQGGFFPDTHEEAFDKLTALIQQLDSLVLRFPENLLRSPLLNVLPSPETNKSLAWSALGKLVNRNIEDTIIIGNSDAPSFATTNDMVDGTAIDGRIFTWSDYLGRNVTTVTPHETYVIVNSDPGDNEINPDLGGGFYAKIVPSGGNAAYQTDEQRTYYTMSENRHVFGEEYLWGFHKYVFDNNNNANCKFVWSGDSTTAGDNAGGYTPSLIGSLLSDELGLARHQHINAGHAGKAATDWDSLYLGQDIVNHPDMNVYIARWGINDGFWHNNVATYISAMDSALTNLRIFKGVEDLAIVVVSPSATYDDPNNRGTEWYERIIPELRKICRKHQAVFVDIYSIWQDAKQGALNTGSTSTGKRWLDNPYGDGRGIHPDAAFACQIGLRITELIIKPALVKANIRNNQIVNIDPDQFNPLSNVQPANYPRFIGCYSVFQADGWPFNGKLRTTKNGSKVIQELFITTAEDTTEVANVIPKKKIVRFGDATAGLWSKWYNRAVAPGLVGGWTQHNSQVQKYVHREDGLCTIEGSVENGIDGNPIFSIPVEMRPASNKTFITLSSAGFYGIVTVQTNGDVIASKNGGTFCGLDGVVWTAGD